MLNQHRKCEAVMDTDKSSSFGGCPSRAKKSKMCRKECDEHIFHSEWKYLPAVVLHEIFDLLSKEDRKIASSVCRNWRQYVFNSKWWPAMTFKIEDRNINKAKFYTATFAKSVSEATVKINSLSHVCMEEFIVLLQTLSENTNLKQLIIEPTHCRFEIPLKRIEIGGDNEVVDFFKLLKPLLSKLNKFSIGCIEDLSYVPEEILKNMSATKVTHLGLASIKDDPSFYQVSYFDADLIIPFNKLKILSIDYDQLSDKFLNNLESAKDLERLVVHLHGVRESHPGTTNNAWKDFHKSHPSCEFRLTVIHAFNDIKHLHQRVLRQHMPLTHLKVFFCESMNMNVLESLSTHYLHTLRSVMWVDSLSDNNGSWIFAKSSFDESPDPFVLISWLCQKLEEIVLYGYKYWEQNLVAIGRLCGEKLKKLEIAEDDIMYYNDRYPVRSGLSDVSKSLKKSWAPVKMGDLHPVICHPTAGDSDEYILPIVLADLH